MRFTIRDGLFLLTLVGVSLGWWIDRRSLNNAKLQLESANAELQVDSFKLVSRLIVLEAYPAGTKRIEAIYDAAKLSPPDPEVAAEILHYVRSEPDFRIRVRAMAVCPYLVERDETISVLRGALRDRNIERSADGVIPLYAVSYLAEMKATTAADDIKSWLDLLRTDSPYSTDITPVLIKGAEKHFATLSAAANF